MTKPYSIEGRLVSRTTFLSLFTIILSLGVIDQVIVSWLKNDFDASLRHKTLVMSTMAEFDQDGLEFEFADEIMPEFERKLEPEYFQITLENGVVFERSRSLGDNAELNYTQDWVEGLYFSDIELLDGRSGRQAENVYTPAIDDDYEVGADAIWQSKVSFVLAQSTESLYRIIHEVHITLIIGGVVIVFLVTILLRTILRSGLKPLSQLEHDIENLHFQNLGAHISIPNLPREIEPIVNKLNEAVDNISQGVVKERRFTGDVAHELRTPIAELKALAEVSIKYGVDEVSCKKLPQDVLEIALLMEQSINNLLALARSDSDGYQLFIEEINIPDLLNKLVCREQELLRTKRIELNICNAIDNLVIQSGLVELQIILTNIINNALEHSQEETQVNITVNQNNLFLDVLITNEVKDLQESDLDCIFDRMWRKDASRTVKGHTGLGMSLVKAYSSILGLKISLELVDKILTVKISGLKLLEPKNVVT